jgi:hypothetical protein
MDYIMALVQNRTLPGLFDPARMKTMLSDMAEQMVSGGKVDTGLHRGADFEEVFWMRISRLVQIVFCLPDPTTIHSGARPWIQSLLDRVHLDRYGKWTREVGEAPHHQTHDFSYILYGRVSKNWRDNMQKLLE